MNKFADLAMFICYGLMVASELVKNNGYHTMP